MKRSNHPINPGKVKRGFRFYCAIVLVIAMMSVMAVTAFATDDSDPIGVVNNLSDFIFGLIRAVGLILLGWGIVQVGLSLQSPRPFPALQRLSHPGRRRGHHLRQGNSQPHHRLIRYLNAGVGRLRSAPGIGGESFVR